MTAPRLWTWTTCSSRSRTPLIGIVYVDDKQLTDTHGALRDLNGQYWVRGITLELAKGFASNAPFVHIEVSVAPDQGRLR